MIYKNDFHQFETVCLPSLPSQRKKSRNHLIFLFYFSYIYPSMDELADQLNQVVLHFNLKHFIGFGVGVGANILCRYTLNHPEMVSEYFMNDLEKVCIKFVSMCSGFCSLLNQLRKHATWMDRMGIPEA